MTPDLSVIERPLGCYRSLPVKASEKLRVERNGGKFGAGLIRGVSLITEGEALGHGEWADAEFVGSVAKHANYPNKGTKIRFTHPSVSGDGLGRYMGRGLDARVEGKQALADVHLAKASRETPDGDLGKYVMDLAEEDPEAFAMSIAFQRDEEAEEAFQEENGGSKFESPVEENTQNYPHVRLKQLIAADFVDEPAANPGGLFHRGAEIADEADRLCAYALGLSDEKPELSLFTADVDRVSAFAQRFLNSRRLAIMSKTTEQTPEQTQGETVLRADYDALNEKFDALAAKLEGLQKEPEQKPEEDGPTVEELSANEQKRVADLYKLASSSGLDNATETAEKWAEQGLSVTEAKAALADRMLASNKLTDDDGKPEDDPDAKYRAEFNEQKDKLAQYDVTDVDAYIRSRKRDEGKDIPFTVAK